jgi:membrane dipeptidase
VIVIDAHQDIAYNALCFGREYQRSALYKRRIEAGGPVPSQNGYAVLGLPEAIAGRVAVVFATLFVAPRTRQAAPWDCVSYDNARQAHDLAQQQLDYYHRLTDSTDKVRIVSNEAALDDVLQTWDGEKTLRTRAQGLVILMENADPILEPRQVEDWYEQGVRIVGPAWRSTRYTGGTGEPGPLTSQGRELLEVMAGLNMILDLSHMAEQAYFESLDIFEGESIIASHSNPRRFVNSDRHLSDAMIRRLAERDGVIGIVPFNAFLQQGWTPGSRKNLVGQHTILDAIDHVCQVTGSAQHVGIGSDFDGGFGAESIPTELDTVADLWRLGDALGERGYDAAEVTAILGGNMLRKLRQGLPPTD